MLGSTQPDTEPLSRARSLHIEHVSPAALKQREISPPSPSRSAGPGRADDSTFAVMRKWFFGRKPDAGFVLADFPATLLQAKVFDEWLEARGEALDAVLAAPGASPLLVAHYRDLGLLAEVPPPSVPEGILADLLSS